MFSLPDCLLPCQYLLFLHDKEMIDAVHSSIGHAALQLLSDNKTHTITIRTYKACIVCTYIHMVDARVYSHVIYCMVATHNYPSLAHCRIAELQQMITQTLLIIMVLYNNVEYEFSE